MPINQLQPFALGAGANVMTPEAYAALAARATGFSAGTANSTQLNTAWRQNAFTAAMIAFFTMHNSGQDVLDNGDLDTYEANFRAAVQAVASELITTGGDDGGGGTIIGGGGEYFELAYLAGQWTFTVPTGCTKITVWAWGAGGGGAGAKRFWFGKSASGGAFRAGTFTVAAGTNFAIRVGAKGVGGAISQPGTNGGATSFGSLLSCGGGMGGQVPNGDNSFAVGGKGTGGDWGVDGQDGIRGVLSAEGGYMGAPGGAAFGSAQSKWSLGSTNPRPASFPGGGGGAAATGNTAYPGYDGADGLVLVKGNRTPL